MYSGRNVKRQHTVWESGLDLKNKFRSLSAYMVFNIMRSDKVTEGVGADLEERTKDSPILTDQEQNRDVKGDWE